MDSTHIKSLIESVAGPIIKNALDARPDNGYGYGLALTAFLVLGFAAVAAVVLIYNRQGKATSAHITTLNKQLKDQAVCSEKVRAIEARLNEHRGENSDRLYQLQLTEIEKRDSTRDHIVAILDKRFESIQTAINTRVGSLESRIGDCQDSINELDKTVLVMRTESKNKPPKEGG